MGAKKSPNKITLQVGFNFEKEQITQMAQVLDKNIGKVFTGNKSKEYFSDISTAAEKAVKQANVIFKDIGKPLSSKNDALKLVDELNQAFKVMDDMLFSVQGNVTKTFKAAGNVEGLNKYKELSNQIDEMVADSKKISELFNQNKALGNKNELKSQMTAARKELTELQKKHGKLSKEEKTHQKELSKLLEENNAILDKKKAINDDIGKIQEKHNVKSQKELDAKIADAELQRDEVASGIMTEQEAETLKQVLSQLRDIIMQIANASGHTKREFSDGWDEQTAAMKKAEEQARTFKSVLQTLGISLSFDWVVRKLKDVIRYSYDYVKNLDKALTEISVVTGKTRSEVMALTDSFIDMSAKTGMAIDDIAQASTIFFQQGLEDSQVAVLSEWTALFAKISGETVQKAADQLTSAINGFGFAAEEVGTVVDKMSVLAAYSAADINELATAMSKGASAAAQAGLSFDQYNAYLATMIEVTREAPENIGTSLKTIMARFQQVKEAGTTEDGETDVNAVETALKSVGIQLRDTDGQLRELGDVLEELGPKWNSLNRNTQAYLGTVIAGTRQQSRFISLMQNWDRAMDLVEASEKSSGAAARMHASAMDSLDASINRLINTWQKLISNITDGDDFKWLIDIGNWLLSFFASGNSMLRVVTAAIALFNAKTLMTNVSLLRQGKEIKNLDTLWGSLKSTLLGTQQVYKDMADQYSAVTIEIEKQTAAIRKLIQAKIDQKAVEAGGTPATPVAIGSNTGTGTDANGKPINPPAPAPSPNNNPGGDKLDGNGGTFGKNVVNLVGKIQTVLFLFTTIMTVLDVIDSEFIHKSDKLKRKADEAYDKQAEEIYKYQNMIDTYEMAGKTYDKLSRKVNKSTEEVEELAKAAEELAEAAPGAIVGYDASGKPIIDMHQVEKAKDDASMQLYNAAMKQISNIGQQVQADVQESAEKAYDESASSTASTVLKAAGIIVAAAGILLSPITGGTSLIGVKAGIAMAGIGATMTGGAYILDKVAIENLKNDEFKEKWEELISDENIAKLKETFSIMNNNFGSSGQVRGTTASQRAGVANYLSSAWLEPTLRELPSIYSDPDELEEAFNNLAEEWNTILNTIGEHGLADLTKALDKVMFNIDDKTYEEVEKEMEKVFKDLDLDLTPEQIKILKKGFMSAAYSGASAGIDLVIKDLENRRDTELKKHEGDEQKYNETKQYYDTAIGNAKKMTTTELGFYDSVGITDDVALFNDIYERYGSKIREALVYNTQTATLESIAILYSYREQAEKELQKIIDAWNKSNPGDTWSDFTDIDYDKLTDDQKVIYDKWIRQAESSSDAIAQAWANLEVATNKTWASIYETLEKATDRVYKIRTVLNSASDGLDYDELKEFNLLLDNINYSALNPEQAKKYSQGLKTITNSMYEINGVVYLNEQGLKAVAEVEEVLMENTIESMKLELMAKKQELEAQRAIVKAQIATVDYLITANSDEVKSEQDKVKKKETAEQAWVNAHKRLNQVLVNNTGTTVSAMVNVFGQGFAAILEKYNKLQLALFTPGTKKETIKQLKEAWEDELETLSFESYESDLKDLYQNDDGSWDIEGLTKHKLGLQALDDALDLEIQGIDYKLATIGMNLRKYGDDAGKAMEEYIGQLEKFISMIKHIEREMMNLEVAGILKDMQTGAAVVATINKELEYTRHLMQDNKELYQEYENEANSAASAILEGFGDMITFDPWGNYEIDMDAYNKLPKEQKELFDGLIKDYDSLIDKRDEYYKQFLDNVRTERDLEQEKVDAYIKAEDELVEAIKEREKAILDNKLEAIDKEIEAIEKASEARRKAREEEQEAQELSSLQTDLQRALMDSSGASATQILEIQKQIKEKQQDIADKSFDTMVDDMTEQLEKEKEMEQKLFDERLEEMDWYWAEVDRIMAEGTESILETMKLYSDEFNKASEIQQNELLKGWDNVFGQATAIGKAKVLELQDTIADLQLIINEMVVDEDILTEGTINTDFVKRPDVAPKDNGNGSGGKKNYGYVPEYPSTDITDGEDNGYTGGDENGIGGRDKIPDPDFKPGDKVKPKVKGLLEVTDAYEWDGKDMNKSSTSYLSFIGYDGNGFTVEEDGIKYYKDQYYYQNGDLWIKGKHLQKYKLGGMVDFTGPAWLDGTKSHPEAVLNSLQTKAFLSFTKDLADLRATGNTGLGTNVTIDTISFNVDSMSSVEDGKIAFEAFVDEFKKIGSQRGISVQGTANRF